MQALWVCFLVAVALLNFPITDAHSRIEREGPRKDASYMIPHEGHLQIAFVDQSAKVLFELLKIGTRSLHMPNGVFLPGEEVSCTQTFSPAGEFYACAFHLGKNGLREEAITPVRFSSSQTLVENLQVRSLQGIGMVQIDILGDMGSAFFDMLEDSFLDEEGNKKAPNIHCLTVPEREHAEKGKYACSFMVDERGVTQGPW